MKSTKRKALLLLLVSLLFFACDKKEKEEIQSNATSESSEAIQENSGPGSPEAMSMLDAVPADTIFFSGGLEPAPLQEVLQWSVDNFNVLKELDPASIFPDLQNETIPGRRMLARLWLDYYAMMLSPKTELARWGIPDKAFLSTYTVGLAPVLLRISLNNIEQFNTKIDELEAEAKITVQPESIGKATYRQYTLNEQNPALDLIIGVDTERQQAVFMFDIGVDSEQTLAVALGQQKPEKTLAETGRIEALQKQYKLHPSFIGYLDHQQLITGLTTKEGNSIARMMQILAPQSQGAGGLLEELRTEGCRNDLEEIGTNWPQTVFGYTALELTASPSRIDSLLVIENKDKALLDSLQSIRGFIPKYVTDPAEAPVVAAGIGLNLEKIPAFLSERGAALAKKEYSCSFLKEIQGNASPQQSAAVAMMSGMAPGVQGLAFSLLSLDLETT
ncbi:MAG: hypothetical protein D3904_06290, partial [Candidatus Electrothrix sp. EH2]|nr:hypothetical protein [Candidatus Electrothrix sp. EH2]